MIGRDINFGQLNDRQLTLRPIFPCEFCELAGFRWRLSARRLLSPRQWWRAVLNPWNWRLWVRRVRGATHRCYCRDGWLFDGSIVVAGFGMVWFYSHYTGEVPCTCDKVMEEFEAIP